MIDRIGMLRNLYALADVAFVGGSLVRAGGHNPLEPASVAKPILFGPHTDDFRWICQTLEKAGGAIRVRDADQLSAHVINLIVNQAECRRVGRCAFGVFSKHRGAVARTLAVIDTPAEKGSMTRLQRFFERFRRRIEMAAKGEDPTPFFSVETVLLVLSVVYGGLMGLRARLYEKGVLPSKTLPCRVVSIGNLIAGGTGKTPMTIRVARMIRDMGYRVVVLSRGYRGRMEKTGGVVSDGGTIFKGPEDAGDEPYLMARILTGIPVVVGQRRYEAGMMAVKRFNRM